MPNKLLASLIKDKPKTPADTVSKLFAALNQLEVGSSDSKAQERALEAVSKYLVFLKIHLFGDEDHQVTKESVLDAAREVAHTDVLYLIVKHLPQLGFEARKDGAQVFGACCKIRDAQDNSPGAKFVREHPYILDLLFRGYDEPSIALNCGAMLRDCFRDEALAKQFIDSTMFLEFFEYVEVANFEIASDAFSTFKDLLTRHKQVVAQYLQEHYSQFFPEYMKLLKSANYVTRRQSLKLLGELLLDRSNVKVMVRFVGEVQHLMQMMMMLKDPSRSIQFEAFHVFKVFVANPNKPQPIIDILANNKEKLLKYLEDFHTDRDEGDEMFKEEKAVLIREISMLGSQPAAAPAAAGTPSQQPPAQPPQQQQQVQQ